ncbi:GtrA family protein [Hoeflea poritis]|uniref:GtrA family protein n=1 Tax=Hoeflea poritis TaxID=2993659 RepID=A0ABT4VKW4_9HYPH|nr:GtrA family protein [Hoeflea poritis]MDA4845324.1 GtrA family protein [Hoeflea poritis]
MRGSKAFHLVSKFALVGLSATLLYAVLATVFEMQLGASLGQATVSIAAYAIAALFSYSAHRVFTFASNGAYRLEIPRFALLTATGAALSFALPAFIGGFLGLPMFVSVACVCVVIPLINFVALDRWVFGDRGN